jgi:hypothetical protein
VRSVTPWAFNDAVTTTGPPVVTYCAVINPVESTATAESLVENVGRPRPVRGTPATLTGVAVNRIVSYGAVVDKLTA